MVSTLNGAAAGAAATDSAAVAQLPFLRGAMEHVEGAFLDVQAALSAAGSIALADRDVPSFGYLRNIILHVTATGGAAGGTNAVADEDGPFNVLRNITFSDVNGRQIVGPLSGWELYLVNKWGGYTGKGFDPKLAPEYSATATSGDFEFMLRIPLEITAREALGVLPNQNTSGQYRVGFDLADADDVYATKPGTLPTVRVRAYMESYTPPAATDPAGFPIASQPPALGTTQMWTRQTPAIAAGDQRVEMQRKGNLIRNLILIAEDDGVREDAELPPAIRLEIDGKTVVNTSLDVLKRYMWERSGMTPEAGVLLIDYTHDLDGSLGAEARHLYLPTTSATRFDLVGTFGAGITSFRVLTNDVVVAGA